MKRISPLPDWHTRSVFFVWPGGLAGRTKCVPAILKLISAVPAHIPVTLIAKNARLVEEALRACAQIGRADVIAAMELPTVMDIWIRDWAPIIVTDREGSQRAVKALYNPSYIGEKDRAYARGDHRAGLELAERLGLPVTDLPIAWDLGNLIHNGLGTAIVTRQVLRDNPGHTEGSIRRLFRKRLGVDTLIFIDPEPGDRTGHMDGTARFLDKGTLAVACYPSRYTAENRWLDATAADLAERLGPAIRIFRIPNGPIDMRITEGLPSARGNHLNFLRIGDHVFMPCYGEEEDGDAMEAIRKECPGIHVIPVGGKEIRELSRFGGVINCVSWGL